MLNSGFKPLGKSDHFESLNNCFKMSKGEKLLDIGCGTGEVSKAFPNWEYTGADLPHIIQDVSQKSNPSAEYIAL